MSNLFADLPVDAAQELVTILAESKQVRIERIVSTGQASPPDFWYDQTQHEWVMVLQGHAELQFKGENSVCALGPGDYVLIAPHQEHRVKSTASDAPTVWLAVFFGD